MRYRCLGSQKANMFTPRYSGALVLLILAGCAQYRLGYTGLYRQDIYTVFVPVFESESLRRRLGERMTEAVAKEIELKTPYKLAQGFNADTVLYGRIIEDNKIVITENVFDEPRDLAYEMFLEVTWRDRNGQILFGPQVVRLPEALQEFGQSVHFVPEAGQSISTAQLEAISRLAEQVVAQMEMPW